MQLKIVKDQRGSLLPIMAAIMVILIAVAAIAVDYIRFIAAIEQLKTATDAAAVASAMSATRYVEIFIDAEGEERGRIIRGRERDIIDSTGNYDGYGGDEIKGIIVTKRWLASEGNSAQAAAENLFEMNRPKEMSPETGGDFYITSIEQYLGEAYVNDYRYPSVVVRSQGRVKTVFMNFLNELYPRNFSYLNASEESQGLTFFYDENGKWHRAAADAID